jgi:hypothetical protein
MLSSSQVSSGTGTVNYTDEELTAMCDQALRSEIIKACACAYWENDRFANSLIDAPERLQAVFDVILGYTRMFGTEEVLERLVEPTQGPHTEAQAHRADSLASTHHP